MQRKMHIPLLIVAILLISSLSLAGCRQDDSRTPEATPEKQTQQMLPMLGSDQSPLPTPGTDQSPLKP